MPAWRFEHETLMTFTTATLHRPDCPHAADKLNGAGHRAGGVLESDTAPHLCAVCRPDATLLLSRAG
jgi:hypothetical protein